MVSLALILAGIQRVRNRKPGVATIALPPASGQSTPWLTCLAHLGSHTQRLRVVDRAYDTQLKRLLGEPQPEGQSESLTVEHADGRKLRLVEIARPETLSDAQLRLMLEAADGVLVIAEPDQQGRELAARLRSSGAPKRIGTPVVDRSPDRDLEANDESSWIWRPLEDLLAR